MPENAFKPDGARKRTSILPSQVAIRLSAIGVLTLLLGTQVSRARVTRFIVEQRVVVAGGQDWGRAGPYERLKGRAYMEVDPRDPRNAVIFNLDKAPRNARGLVEFSSPFLILKPVDIARGNHKIWFGVNNRGNCIELGFRALPIISFPVTKQSSNCSPLATEDIGANNVLLNEGYAFVDAGWQGDGIPDPAGRQLFPSFPVAIQPNGSPIVGPLRLEYRPASNTFTWPLPDPPLGVRVWRPYEAADIDTTQAKLTVRDLDNAPRLPIAPSQWAFGQCPAGQTSLVPSRTEICLFNGFVAGKIYELVYAARDPTVMGLAYAVIRDIGSFLRYATQDSAGNPNPLSTSSSTIGIRRAYSSGLSSTGMYQREFLYLGFNEDEEHRKVFDGVTIYTAGTDRLFANLQFAHPTFLSQENEHHDFTSTAIAPMSFAVTKDPVTGITDGLLKRPSTDPLVIQIDGEAEFWQWRASLNVVDGLGNPVPVPSTVRLYFQDGFQHIGAIGLLTPSQPTGTCTDQSLIFSAGPVTLRALVRVMDDWADRGILPPKSNYPTQDDLIPVQEYRAKFPLIPGIDPPRTVNEVDALNFGPLFNSQGGNQTVLPPLTGAHYRILVPRPGPDGSAASGIHTIYTRAPIGTNLGWSARVRSGAGKPCDESFLPFSATKAKRLAAGDSRKSLQERYRDHDGFVRAVAKAATQLVKERFLLEEDAQTFITAAQNSSILK
jgi:Alpha/beta hydrolase domain